MTDDIDDADEQPTETKESRRQRIIEEELRDHPDLPHHCEPHDLRADDKERLDELAKLLAQMVGAGTVPKATSLSLLRVAMTAAKEFVPSKLKLNRLLFHLVVAADIGVLQEGTHWVRPEEGIMAFHLATTMPLLLELGVTRIYGRELRPLLQQGSVTHRRFIIATRDRVTFGLKDRRRALMLRDGGLRVGGAPPKLLIRKGPCRGLVVPDDLSARALHERLRSERR